MGSTFCLSWTIIFLGLCMTVQLPNSSFFPEIDFASKCVAPTSAPLSAANLLYPLSNAASVEVGKRLAGNRFFVGEEGKDDGEKDVGENVGHVVVGLAPTHELQKGNKYS